MWYWYKKILEIIISNNAFWNQLNSGTKDTIFAWIRMIGDMISHQGKESSDWSNDKSSSSKGTDSKLDSHSQNSDIKDNDANDKPIELSSSSESENKEQDEKSWLIINENQKESNSIQKENKNNEKNKSEKEKIAEQQIEIDKTASTDVENQDEKKETAKNSKEIYISKMVKTEETKGNLTDVLNENSIKSSNLEAAPIDSNESIIIVKSEDEPKLFTDLEITIDSSSVKHQNYDGFVYPDLKLVKQEKIYLAGCYSNEELKNCLVRLDNSDLDRYKKDARERQTWSELMGDNIPKKI